MKIQVSIKKIIGYSLIYFMVIMNQSNISRIFLSEYLWVIFIIFGGMLFFFKCKIRDYCFVYLIVLLSAIVLVRLWAGGIGLRGWILWGSSILVTAYVVKYNGKEFIFRYVKVVTFLAGISLVIFTLCQVAPGIWQAIAIPFTSLDTVAEWSSSTEYTRSQLEAYGLFTYTLSAVHPTRNTSIFTEPGIYQMLLNSALFVLLFLNDELKISRRQRSRYLLILGLAILTAQSTTGYIGMIAISLCYLISTKGERHMRYNYLFILFFLILALLMDYIINANESILYSTLINKLFDTTGQFDLNASSGEARTGTILICLSSIASNPLGVGYDALLDMLDTENTGYVAASFVADAAALGIIPYFAVIYWLFSPIIKSSLTSCGKILLIFLYLNTTLAQSNTYYPALICIHMYLYQYLSLERE